MEQQIATEIQDSDFRESTFELLAKFKRDMKLAAQTLTGEEARYLVDAYYQIQQNRIRAYGQARAQAESKEPNLLVNWIGGTFHTLEGNIKAALHEYAKTRAVGRWSLAQYGIGPVIAAGLLAHFDLTKMKNHNSVAGIWRFAGLDPTLKWNKGEKRPYNADAKVLCWKMGESFKKFHNKPECVYGRIYKERKELEVANNEALKFADQAKVSLETRNIRDKKLKETYESGKLPAGRLDLRATRKAVQIFLSHWHYVAHLEIYKVPAAAPYAIDILKHSHMIEVPGIEKVKKELGL